MQNDCRKPGYFITVNHRQILPSVLKGNLFMPDNNDIGIEEHALLYGLLAKHICAVIGEEQGRKVMAEATILYGHVRGQRMRKNADERNLGCDIAAYQITGEWSGKPGENSSHAEYDSDSYTSCVTLCKWHETWKKYDLLEYGSLYCQYIDKALVEGFSGDFSLSVNSVLSKGDTQCEFVFAGTADSEKANKLKPVNSDLILPFSFHVKELLDCTRMIMQKEIPETMPGILTAVKDELSKLKPDLSEFLFSDD